MKSFTEKQAQIDSKRQNAMTRYADMWAQTTAEWRSQNPPDRAWLVYCANYLMRTGNVRWALDPLWLCDWLPGQDQANVAQDLRELSFVLLTHEHDDHLDLRLIRSLRDLPTRWVVPENILPRVLTETGLSSAKIIVPQLMVPFQIDGMTITPFEGMHWDYAARSVDGTGGGSPHGVPSTGYMVEHSGKRWLFPGDVRTYNAQALPSFGGIDVLFSHVWLGRGAALSEAPPLLEAFCRFCVKTGAQQVVLAHLEEYGRDANDYWDADHIAQVVPHLKKIAPGLCVIPAYMGQSIEL